MHTWHKNYSSAPLACYNGLFSDTTDQVGAPTSAAWPARADGPLINNIKYEYIHQHDINVKQITLDDYVARTGIVPDALTMDVEGAEMRVLQGAAVTLAEHHPQIWVSVHPDLMARDYGNQPHDVHGYLAGLGYTGTHLATDHEQHFHYFH
jgi:hypothetical protein